MIAMSARSGDSDVLTMRCLWRRYSTSVGVSHNENHHNSGGREALGRDRSVRGDKQTCRLGDRIVISLYLL